MRLNTLMKAILAIAATCGRGIAPFVTALALVAGCDGGTLILGDSGNASSAPETEQDDTGAPSDSGTPNVDTGTPDDQGDPPAGEGDEDGDGFLATDGEGNTVDCDDANPDMNPGADDSTCDGIDQDCDGEDGSDLRAAGEGLCGNVDLDGDGYLDMNGDGDVVDCDDADETVHPGATEVADDGIDQDCDGEDLESEPADTDEPSDPNDVDGDGHEAESAGGDDCDDADATIFPGATEVPYDGIDQDCTGLDLIDVDCDGVSYTVDCDDENADVSPLESEVMDNGIDDDCDGTIDDGSVEEEEPVEEEPIEEPIAETEEGAAACLNGADDDLDGLTDADDFGCLIFIDEDADILYLSPAIMDIICDTSGCDEADSAYAEASVFIVGDSPWGPWDELQIDNELDIESSGYYEYDPAAAGANDFEGSTFSLVSSLSADDVADAATMDDQSDWAWAFYGDWCGDTGADVCYDNGDDTFKLQMSHDSSTGDLYAGDVEI